jgi:ABC-type uncharacterized transport system substrate-binding protein
MKNAIKQLWLIFSLIMAASLILLFSDRGQRIRQKAKSPDTYPSIAIMQISSTTLLESHVAGVVARLDEKGLRAPDGKNIRLYNPQGDFSTANAMARDLANGPYDIVITSSTVALQVFSKANLSTRKNHVFGAVTDPYGAGVGIKGPGADQHPPYMAGVGSFQPVKSAIRIAFEMNPGLKRLGVVWNPGEQCSEACLKEAKEICKELGIELVEAIAVNTSEVAEAARSLVAKNVDAIWIGGDTVAMASIGLIINLAKKAGIPVFTNDPMDADKGALFGLGADYFTVGQYTADMASSILEGKKPSEFRIENVVPEVLNLNEEVRTSLKDAWQITPAIRGIAGVPPSELPVEPTKIQKTVEHKSKIISQRTEPFKLRLVLYSETEFAERCRDGLIDGINQAGLKEGLDYKLIEYNAQGDMSTLSSIMTTVKSDRVDLLMVISTPTLQAALRQAGEDTKIVFTGVGDGVKAGAGKSETDHLPNVTGISTRSPFGGMAHIIKKTLPGVRNVGTLFTPGEINSVLYKDWFKEALKAEGIELVAIPVTSGADVAQSAIELCSKEIQAVAQIVDNLTRPGFALIARKSMEKNLPVYVFDSDQMKDGGTICLARDYYDAGLEAAEKAVRILKGENPKIIPFSNTKSEKLILNPELADRYGLVISEELEKTAHLYTPK